MKGSIYSCKNFPGAPPSLLEQNRCSFCLDILSGKPWLANNLVCGMDDEEARLAR